MSLGGAALLVALLAGCSGGVAAPEGEPEGKGDEHGEDGAPNVGKWRRVRIPDEAQQTEMAQLEALGYADGSRDVRSGQVVTRYDKERAWEGVNFYTSGHTSEAFLVDMDGKVMHRWARKFGDIFPKFKVLPDDNGVNHWRRGLVLDNGDMLGIYEGWGLFKLNKDSELVWAYPERAHHHFQVLPDGDILVLTRKARPIDEWGPGIVVLEDFIVRLGADGTQELKVSILDAFLGTEFEPLLRKHTKAGGDIFHTNSVELLDGRSAAKNPAFKAGRVLISMRTPSLLAVVDLDEKKVVWAHRGDFRQQHDATILENGNILLFDNRGLGKISRVVEYNPADMSWAWSFIGTSKEPFYSATMGSNEVLPNGDLLLTESDGGRAIEITRKGEVVWEFYNPHRAGENGEFIAALFELVRLPKGFGSAWARPPAPPPDQPAH